ncbi:ADP-ribosylglycohydrolase family protein [Herpetosiphon geysericola]|uniref:ADP-ribosylglycohydrolase n=1 Tax=Herpetosiphon geysericola TaxID=70996 RepID=A0A0P6YE68_9CHLR|nr:ADP-ribosylglycohydrolase family protein [Herpetosiphon geysericola]KPL90403.1 ADP-ribosylglycohydrolase [Herpetosiphon geysericola]
MQQATIPWQLYAACLVGAAIGDALGATLEFQRPGSFAPISDMFGGGVFNLAPGQWTDDTAMLLCLAESLIESKGFDPVDQMQRYRRWLKAGHLSSTGGYIDSGRTIREAINYFIQTGDAYAGDQDRWSAGNGSLMRIAPIALAYVNNPQLADSYAAASSRTTHGNQIAIDACRYFTGLIIGALQGVPKTQLLAANYHPLPNYWQQHALSPEIAEFAAGSFRERQPPAIEALGYVPRTLEAALWAFYHSTSFEQGCLLAVNLGNDADTTGAIYGQLAGAYYGEVVLHSPWAKQLALKQTIATFAVKLYLLARGQGPVMIHEGHEEHEGMRD